MGWEVPASSLIGAFGSVVVVDGVEPSTLESNGCEHETSAVPATSARTSARASNRRSARRHDAVAEAPKMPCIIAASLRHSASTLRRSEAPKSDIAPGACVSGSNRTTRQGLHKISIERSCGVGKDPPNTATRFFAPSLHVLHLIVRGRATGRLGGLRRLGGRRRETGEHERSCA